MRIRWRGLELPNRVVADRGTLTDTYGKFSVEPFERGFGTTVGNSLRRILLSSIEGAAVTSVRIKGAEHEFSTLKGVPDHVICTLSDAVDFEAELTVGKGRGYQPASEQYGKNEEQVIGVIPIDAVF